MTDDQLIHRRILRAPRELVWRCMTEPDHLAMFWGPRGTSTPVDGIVVELRVGGRFETLMIGEGAGHRMSAVFTEIIPPEQLAWREPATGMHTTTTFTDLGDDRTEIVIHQRHVPLAARSPEARAGFLTSLDEFETYLARLDPPHGGHR
ncbi:SRPBCC family protein [Pseudonocardia ailaonensis]|uniref:SRPBCC family protein n=1 Tax=Pseudonocardia ailaonensis TaxID=367279 RepID=A0ABN2NGL7_9PSEU